MDKVVSFPGLGLEFHFSNVAFSIGEKPIYWYGIIIAAGFILAVIYASRRAPQFGISGDDLSDMAILALPVAVICARIYYVIFQWEDYKDNLSEVIAIWHGGLAIYGGVIGALLAVALYDRKNRLSIPGTFDVAVLGLLIGQCIGRWGNFVNGEAHGSETTALLGMTVNGEGPFHPTFLYESLWNFVGFWVLHFISKKCYRFKGQLFLCYLIWYGAGRAWIEGLRTDSLYLGGTGIRVSQLVAVASCVVGVVLLILCLRRGVETLTQLVDPHADPRAVRAETTKES